MLLIHITLALFVLIPCLGWFIPAPGSLVLPSPADSDIAIAESIRTRHSVIIETVNQTDFLLTFQDLAADASRYAVCSFGAIFYGQKNGKRWSIHLRPVFEV